MGDDKKMFFTQIWIEVEVEVIKSHFEVDMEAHTIDIVNMKVNLMEVDEETSEKECRNLSLGLTTNARAYKGLG